MRPYSPGGALTALAPAPTGSRPPAPSAHRLQRGLPGYLILFAPHAVAPQCQNWSSWPPSPRVFSPISTHFTATQGIPPAPPSLKSCSFYRQNTVEPYAFTIDIQNHLRALYANDSEQRLPLPYYRGCWHGISRGFLWRYRLEARIYHPRSVVPPDRSLQPEGLHPHAALLRQAFAHCAKFPTAASRRSLARVSVPVWLIILSDQLPIVALVGRYPANKLMGRKLIPNHEHETEARFPPAAYTSGTLSSISPPFGGLSQSSG